MTDEKTVKAQPKPSAPSAVELLEQAAATLDAYSGDRVKRARRLAAQIRELAAKAGEL